MQCQTKYKLFNRLKNIKHPILKQLLKENPKLLPDKPEYEIEFLLKKSTAQFANYIWSCITMEFPVKCLSYDDENFNTSDKSITCHDFKHTIEALVIDQKDQKLEATLNITNNTNEPMAVFTKHLVFKLDGKITPYTNIIDNVQIATLASGHTLSVKKFCTREGTARKNKANGFCICPHPEYKILDHKSLEYDEKTKKYHGVSSLEYDAEEFQIILRTYGNIKIDAFKGKLIQCMKKEIEHVKKLLSEVKEIPYTSEHLNISNVQTYTFYDLKNKSPALGKLIARYAFKIDPQSPMIAANKTHIDDIFVRIILHKTIDRKILTLACEKIISDITKFGASFKL